MSPCVILTQTFLKTRAPNINPHYEKWALDRSFFVVVVVVFAVIASFLQHFFFSFANFNRQANVDKHAETTQPIPGLENSILSKLILDFFNSMFAFR